MVVCVCICLCVYGVCVSRLFVYSVKSVLVKKDFCLWNGHYVIKTFTQFYSYITFLGHLSFFS